MSRDLQNEGQYLDLRASQSTDTSFLGGLSLSARSTLFFFIGLFALGAIVAMYFHVDQRLTLAMSSLKNSQKISMSISDLSRAIGEVRLQDRHVREGEDSAALQIHRRAVDQVLTSLDAIQKTSGTGHLGDSLGTIRDAVSNYGLEFSTMQDDRNSLGLNRDTGLRVQRRDAATNIRAILGGMDLPELLADFNIIDDRADHDPVLISEQDKNKTRTMYINLAQKVESMSEDAALRSKITELLHIHNTVMDTMIDTKARLEVVPQSVDDIIEYIVPSLREISDFGEQLSRVSPVTYEREYVMVRKILAAGSTIIVVVVVVVGLILMRSITSPVTRISEAVMRLVNGDRALSIPLQGNADAVGDMARSLDKWLDNLAEIEHLRAELDDTRMRLTLGAIAEAVENPDSNNNAERDEPENEIVVEQMADEDDLPEKDAPEGVEDFGQRALQPQPPFEPAPLLEIARHSGDEETIGAATRQLNQYNANVTEAAKEVERTETLINLLSGATQQIAGLEVCISSIRDEANLMVFNAITPSNGSGTEKALLELPGDEDNQQPSKLPDQRHKNDGRRFEVLRSKAGNAEQMIDDILSSIDAINNVAHEIATAASAEALEATSKLLSQSERLQTMLDELVNKVGPLSKKSEEL